LLRPFAGEAQSMDAHAIPAAASGVLFMVAAALIVAVLLVYFALGVADADLERPR
jgi:hypothetical protein